MRTFIQAEWPGKLEKGEKGKVRIWLFELGTTPRPVASPGQTAVIRTPRPISIATPGVPLRDSFGTAYHGLATVRLTGPDFKEELERDLDLPEPSWEWTVSSTTRGNYPLTAEMDAVFKLRTPPGDERGPIPVWREDFDIEITESLLSRATLRIGATFFTFLGSIFAAPFVYGVIKDVAKRRSR